MTRAGVLAAAVVAAVVASAAPAAARASDGFGTIPGIFFLGASRTITDSVVR